MLETYKRKFSRAIDDKDFVNSISEYISELGICPEHVCRYCKGRSCKDHEGFYDIDECPANLKQRLGNWFVLPKSAWNPPCNGKDCEILMICFISAVRELFYDTHGRIWYPDVIEKIKQYDLWEQPGYDPVHLMSQQSRANSPEIRI
jgi:hypothetical protein